MPATVRTNGLVLTEHEFSVPLDHSRAAGERITVFVREVSDPDGLDRPYLVFLQGGPGMEAPRPTRHPSVPGWLDRALRDFRVLMLDQRGTGRSSPIGTMPGLTAEQQADRLKLFRADSIVRDAESIRLELGVERWSVLGQSFGGFCAMTYLSIAPEGLCEALIAGGAPPIGRPTDDVYAATYRRVLDRNRQYFGRYPADRDRVLSLLRRLEVEEVWLPSGDRLTGRRFRQLGSMLGMSDGAEHLHYILELPAESSAFLHDAERALPFSRNPLYAVIHEASYADGCATRWSAHRLLPADYESPELFTGEHVYPWMFEEYGSLAPLRGAAEILAGYTWPRLFDESVLRANEVPVAAAIYANDMYVEREFSEETARLVRGLRAWITSEFEHNGLRAAGSRVLGHLLDLARGRA
ncbi:MAG TPA: alpha/beta fold hydrolase [Candidatus Dormibacteraeota bacterium]|nr:alpha/beta fold hydrolase [Candidatus Dormibacteraeota bacterium]